jgi:hypothetical protein
MAERVQLAAQSEGLILNSLGSTLTSSSGASVHLYTHNTKTPVVVYAAETGEATLTLPLTAGADGSLPGWVETGQRIDVEAEVGGFKSPIKVMEAITGSSVTTKAVEEHLPVSVGSSSRLLLDVTNYGPVDTPTHFVEALNAAQADAKAKPGNIGIWFPARAEPYEYNQTLIRGAHWFLADGATIKQAAEFTYTAVAGIAQWAIVNEGFALTYSNPTAYNVIGGKLVFQNTIGGGKGGFGLANCGGAMRNVAFSAIGTGSLQVIDEYACTQKVTFWGCTGTNTTEAATSGAHWVRNHTSAPTNPVNVTQDNKCVYCEWSGSTEDEVQAFFSGGGMVRNNRQVMCKITALASSREHAKLTSCFPLSHNGELVNAAVEGNELVECELIDVAGTLKKGGSLHYVGAAEDKANICQRNGDVRCTYRVATKLAANEINVVRNALCTFEGADDGNVTREPKIYASTSEQPIETAIRGFGSVIVPKVKGNVNVACRSCTSIVGGTMEAKQKLFYDCVQSSGGNHTLTTTGGQAYLFESFTATTATHTNIIHGGEKLVEVKAAVGAARIMIEGNTQDTTAETGKIVNNASAEAKLEVRNNSIAGPVALTRAGTIVSSGNDWYGVPDRGTVLAAGRSAEMVGGEITIATTYVTATNVINITTEGGTAIGASVVERKPGESFKVKATAASTDRINWQILHE